MSSYWCCRLADLHKRKKESVELIKKYLGKNSQHFRNLTGEKREKNNLKTSRKTNEERKKRKKDQKKRGGQQKRVGRTLKLEFWRRKYNQRKRQIIRAERR